MTGYGSSQNGWLRVEMRSVNHRFLDISIKAPPSFLKHEMKLRKLLQQYFFRGHIDVFITVISESVLTVNKEFIKNATTVLRQLKSEFGLGGEIDISTVFSFKEAFVNDQKDMDEALITACFIEAIDKLKQMRMQEGALLLEELLPHVDYMEEILDRISSLNLDATTKMFEKTKQKMQELVKDLNIDETRILQEAAILSEKMDISEEIERLRGHIKQFRQNISINDKIGKRLDFIVQELNREANTITSKADEFEVKVLATDFKLETEKLREQVQNVQ